MTEFRIEQDEFPGDLARQITELLADGWSLHGDLIVVAVSGPNDSGEIGPIYSYVQVLTKCQ